MRHERRAAIAVLRVASIETVRECTSDGRTCVCQQRKRCHHAQASKSHGNPRSLNHGRSVSRGLWVVKVGLYRMPWLPFATRARPAPVIVPTYSRYAKRKDRLAAVSPNFKLVF